MEKAYRTEGIIVKRRNFRESDKLITLMTPRYGKITVIGRGIRKISSRRAPHLDLLGCVDLYIYRGKGQETISEVNPVENFLHIKRNISVLAHVYHVLEILDRLCADNVVYRDIYLMLKEYLRCLDDDQAGNDPQESSYRFINRILWETGYAAYGTFIPEEKLDEYVEGILERKLKSPLLLTKI